jgi:hypothetical protein
MALSDDTPREWGKQSGPPAPPPAAGNWGGAVGGYGAPVHYDDKTVKTGSSHPPAWMTQLDDLTHR